MIYKSFAVVTLIAAPIIVLTVQSFLPQTAQEAPAPAPAPMAPVAVPAVQPAPPPPPVSASSFGEPVPEAGKPALAPGAGLPDAARPEPPAAVAALPQPGGPPE